MSENQSSRRKFLQLLGLTAGATLISTSASAAGLDLSEIRTLNREQQDFMINYEKWMDEFIPVIRNQKTDPDNEENNLKMIALTEKAEEFRPQLTEFMKDENFSLIYRVSIERMSKEI